MPGDTGDIPFSIGNVTFQDEEVPEELRDLGSEQHMAIFNFAGGGRSIQLFGTQEPDKEFDGILLGADAMQRAIQLKQLVPLTTPSTLRFGPFEYLGFLKKFDIKLKSQFYIHYSAHFVVGNVPFGQNQVAQQAPEQLLSDAQNNLNNKVNSPPAPFPAGNAQLNTPGQPIPFAAGFDYFQQQAPTQFPSGSLTQYPTSAPVAYSFSAGIQSGVVSLNGLINQTLLNNGGALSSVPTFQLNQMVAAVDSLAANMTASRLASGDLQFIAGSISAEAYLQVIRNILTSSQAPIKEIVIQNPDLFDLAAQYYQDWGLWGVIAAANPAVKNDPMPVGNFTLKIPPRPVLPS